MARVAYVVVRCEFCSKDFNKRPSQVKSSKIGLHFCSQECWYAYSRQGRVAKECAHCGRDFTCRASQALKGRAFCSMKCYEESVKAARVRRECGAYADVVPKSFTFHPPTRPWAGACSAPKNAVSCRECSWTA